MREIKFRGKNTKGEWVYGSLVVTTCGLRHKQAQQTKTWIVESAFGNGGWFNVTRRQYVKPETVGQFTGMIDKNGKEIYEGDILCDYRLDGTYRMFKIFRSKGGFVFNTHQDDFKKPINQILFTESCSDMQNAGFLETCEIEGNIWTYVW